VVRGLSATGGVITSAGLVLAGTFLVLDVLPVVMLAEIGFVVGFGVLLDALLVRTVLVPALAVDLGGRLWWPGRLWRRERERDHPVEAAELLLGADPSPLLHVGGLDRSP
jgi:RND superfamily putative drug exporter